MADAQKTVAIIFEGDTSSAEAQTEKLNQALRRIEGAAFSIENAPDPIKGIGTDAEAATPKVEEMNKSLEATSKTEGSLLSVGNALKALAASLVVRDWVDANANAEQFLRTMQLVTGDSQAAARELEYVRETSNRLGLEVRSASDSFARLAAATKGTALEGDGARVIFEAVAGTLAALGRSSSDTERALVQVAQGVSKGKFELEDLKSIAEVMPGFFDQFAASLNKTTPELFDLIGQGKIGTKEFLAFANVLNENLGSAKFDGYQQNLNRLKNALTEAFVILGDAGAWDVFVSAIKTATASVIGAIGFIRLLGETWGNVAYTLTSGDIAGFGARFEESMAKAAASMRPASDALLGIEDGANKAGFSAAEAGKKIADGMAQAKFSADEFLKTFDNIVRTTTSQTDLAKATTDLVIAFSKGDIEAGAFYTRLDDVQKKQLELDKALGGATTALFGQQEQMKKNAAETDKARAAAEKFQLEMEKLASNERIKLIEAAVKINVAQIEADSKVAVAAFDSINKTVESTGETLSDLFGILAGGTKSWDTWRRLTEAIELEQKRRTEALEMQNKLLQAQIDLANARAASIQQGGALITIDGAGLQPHLEAFMWEILRTIQVRVNSDGLEMLMGL